MLPVTAMVHEPEIVGTNTNAVVGVPPELTVSGVAVVVSYALTVNVLPEHASATPANVIVSTLKDPAPEAFVKLEFAEIVIASSHDAVCTTPWPN